MVLNKGNWNKGRLSDITDITMGQSHPGEFCSNNKMNKTLEEIAQTLYKHWFIDFEIPNENGKQSFDKYRMN